MPIMPGGLLAFTSFALGIAIIGLQFHHPVINPIAQQTCYYPWQAHPPGGTVCPAEWATGSAPPKAIDL
jgi:hypothetical protein